MEMELILPSRSCQGRHESPPAGGNGGPDLAARIQEIQCGSEIGRAYGYDRRKETAGASFSFLFLLFFFSLLPPTGDW
jgi:hypothetical protein